MNNKGKSFKKFVLLWSGELISAIGSGLLGISETIVAAAMLVTSILIGFLSIEKGYVKMLSVSLFFTGIFMIFFGLRENIVMICIAGKYIEKGGA